MKKQVKNILINSTVVLVSLLICFLIGEIICRAVFPGDSVKGSLLFSSDTFQVDSNGAVRFRSNERIRAVTVYNGQIEFDVEFRTNNLGFIDSKDYPYESPPNSTHYAFVGDSFTAGFEGGQAWVPELRDTLLEKSVVIYNLGISGTGFEHFSRLLKSAREQVDFSHIVLLAISNDFERTFWYPVVDGRRILFCDEGTSESQCRGGAYLAKAGIMGHGDSAKEILELANDLARHGPKTDLPTTTRIKKFAKRSRLLRSAKDVWASRKPVERRYEYAFSALREIRRTFPQAEIDLLHLPEKHEVAAGRYMLDDIGEAVQGIGIRYYPALLKCEWSNEMFFPNDSHPNSLGYHLISQCVSNYLFQPQKEGT